jgi:hypothetical protein
MVMKKVFMMHVKASVFFGANDRSPETESVVRQLFYLPADANLDETTVCLSIRMEDFLWHFFVSVPQPSSPLKLAAHKRKLDKIAETLNDSLDKEELPALTKGDLELIREFMDSEDAFDKIQVPFNAHPHNPLPEGESMKAIPLPATNVLRDIEFVSALDALFNGQE